SEGGREYLARGIVADVERLSRRIGHCIVRPRRQAVLAAVPGPGAGAAGGRDVKAKAVIGDDIDPGRRCMDAAVKDRDIFLALPRKAADTVEELQFFDRWWAVRG